MSNSIAPGSSADINVKVTALTTNPNVPVTYKTIILKKNLVNGVNTLTQEMIFATNTKYVVKYDYTLGEDITIPENCVLEFNGGSIDGAYTITGANTEINANLVKILGTDVILTGTWNVIEAYPEWFGAKGDNTQDDYDALLKTIESFNNIKFQPIGIYNITKTIVIPPNRNIDFNGCTIYWDGIGVGTIYGAMFKTDGDHVKTDTVGSVTDGITRGNNYVSVNDTSIFAKGDIVLVKSANTTDRPYIYLNKIAKIVTIDNDKLYLDTFFAFDVPLGDGINVTKIVSNKNIVIKNGNFTSKLQATRNDGMSAIILNYAVDSRVENCIINKFWFNGVAVRFSDNIELSNIIVKDPPVGAGDDRYGGGDAYGIQFNYSDNCKAKNVLGYNLRHICDCTCACNILLSDFVDYNSVSTSFNHHSCYEDGVTYERCKSYNSYGYAFAVGTDPSNNFGRTSWNIKLIDCEAYNCGNYALAYYNEGYGLTAKNCKFYSKNFGACFGNNGCYFENCEFNKIIVTKAPYINDEHKSVINNSRIINSELAIEIVGNQSIEITNSYIDGKIWLLDGSKITLDGVTHKGSRAFYPFQFDYTKEPSANNEGHVAVTDTEKIIIKNCNFDWQELIMDIPAEQGNNKRYFNFLGLSLEITNTTIDLGTEQGVNAIEVPIGFCSKHTKLINNNFIGRFLTSQDTIEFFAEGNYVENPVTATFSIFNSSLYHKYINNTFVGNLSRRCGISINADTTIATFIFIANTIKGAFDNLGLTLTNGLFKDNVVYKVAKFPEATETILVSDNILNIAN